MVLNSISLFTLLLSLQLLVSCNAFSPSNSRRTSSSSINNVIVVRSTAQTSSDNESSSSTTTTTPSSSVPTSRFVVQNRFQVRSGREAAFEKRWADRESRLGTLNGFRFFCMLRRVDNNSEKNSDDDPNNYLSCTVWETYNDFEAWKKGDAFKEAHGGGTVGGVLSMLAATARNTRGKPKPAFWQGLLPETLPGNPPQAGGEGWKRVEADGVETVPTDCFVAMNRFSVTPGMEDAFETRFASRDSTLKKYDGFRGFLLLKRDGGKKPGDGRDPDDGVTHSTFSIWESKTNFDAWMSDQTKNKRGGGQKKEGNTADSKPSSSSPPIYARPPVPTFYEGFLSLESSPGL